MRASEMRDLCAHIVLADGDLEIEIFVWEDASGTEEIWTEVHDGKLLIGYGEKPDFRPWQVIDAEREVEAERRTREIQARMEEKYPEHAGLWPWS